MSLAFFLHVMHAIHNCSYSRRIKLGKKEEEILLSLPVSDEREIIISLWDKITSSSFSFGEGMLAELLLLFSSGRLLGRNQLLFFLFQFMGCIGGCHPPLGVYLVFI